MTVRLSDGPFDRVGRSPVGSLGHPFGSQDASNLPARRQAVYNSFREPKGAAEAIGFKLLYGLVILRLERRGLVWTNVTANPTAEWIAQQITFPWDETPGYLIRDRDTSCGTAVTRGLQAMGIRDRPITPRLPWQNGHVERLIGSIRRECLDHVVVLGEKHLRHLLANYATYYNGVRTHLALDKITPLHRPARQSGISRLSLGSAVSIGTTFG